MNRHLQLCVAGWQIATETVIKAGKYHLLWFWCQTFWQRIGWFACLLRFFIICARHQMLCSSCSAAILRIPSIRWFLCAAPCHVVGPGRSFCIGPFLLRRVYLQLAEIGNLDQLCRASIPPLPQPFSRRVLYFILFKDSLIGGKDLQASEMMLELQK